jgi:DNA polymerase I-like protein with 3'-5' exonuclease and polymerase domains
MGNLFDLIEDTCVVHNDVWRPSTPPSLSNMHEIYLNVETTGLMWWEKDRPLSISLCLPDNTTHYLPWGHRGGGNLSEEVMKRWCEQELRGKRIVNINTRFDVHMLREWGIDLEAQGNTVSDVGHYAALLDDHRLYMNLDSLIKDYLKETPMQRLDESHMKDFSAGAVAPRSMYNALSVKRLRDLMWPMLEEQELQTVRALEDKVIYVTCEMEKNGAPIDEELLDRWIKESRRQLDKLLLKIAHEVGFQCIQTLQRIRNVSFVN